MIYASQLKSGKWLAAAREWIQSRCVNGSDVTWGSGDVLRPNLRVNDVEEIARHAAAAAINQYKQYLKAKPDFSSLEKQDLILWAKRMNAQIPSELGDSKIESSEFRSFLSECYDDTIMGMY